MTDHAEYQALELLIGVVTLLLSSLITTVGAYATSPTHLSFALLAVGALLLWASSALMERGKPHRAWNATLGRLGAEITETLSDRREAVES